MKWTRTIDRMPEYPGEYLVWLIPHKPQQSSLEPGDIVHSSFSPYIGRVRTYTSKQGKMRFNCGATEFPEYWMPLPQPPCEGNIV